MAELCVPLAASAFAEQAGVACTVIVGVTHAQTCIVLGPRLRALREAGFHVILVSSPGVLLDQTAERAGVERVAIPMQRGIAPLKDLVSLWRVWRLLGRLKPRLVEFGTPKAGLLGMLAAALRSVPCRIYLLRGLRLETKRGWTRKLLLITEQMACACAHVVLCNSASLRDKAAALGMTPAVKLRLLGEGSSMGVDMDRFSPGTSAVRQSLGWGVEVPVIGFVGRLTRDKGLKELIDAFESVLKAEPEAHLLLAGWFDASEDAADAGLRARIESHASIHCTGFVEDTAPYYRAMDVMVLPTWREGFPNVVLEAQACGVPVVTTLATGARDSVSPGVTGLLVPPGYPQAIAEAVLKLLRDPERRRQMGRAARRWVGEHYADQRVLRLTVEFYRGMVESRTREAGKAGREIESAFSSF